MRLPTFTASVLTLAVCATANVIPQRRAEPFAGYLMTGFFDNSHNIEQFLSVGNDPINFKQLNQRKSILNSDIGTGGIRDPYLTTNPDRSVFYLIATVVWTSPNMADWSGPYLPTVEVPDAGMVWAPSAVYDETKGGWDVFWSSRFYDNPAHSGWATYDRIRTSFTTDFATFSTPRDYISFADTSVIDQEFQYLGSPGNYVRFLKNVTTSQIFAEKTTTGVFGTWDRIPGNAREESPREGALAYKDNVVADKYYLWVDDYIQYIAYETTDILNNAWEPTSSNGIPPSIKHGSVFSVTQAECDLLLAKYPF
ncbi:unnamed protein product [Clonostachys rosea f. rosea IK726]|uniref:Glycoside hydrolase family 43 protein n=2 Tax=Bionectria ochroleuca TaxID=29856 RepID=A0A0B7KQW5_BIOOC|nr:unnamed protein product [Clonostachys rosea f. rosea IK726]